MTIVYRQEKGAPLTAEELDGNFRDLQGRVQVLESASPVFDGLKEVQCVEGVLRFISHKGTSLGEVPLRHCIQFHGRGKWESGVNYNPMDLAFHQKAVYLAKAPHTSTQWASDQPLYWDMLMDFAEGDAQVGATT